MFACSVSVHREPEEPVTPAPTPVPNCKLPLYPASDPAVTPQSGLRFGTLLSGDRARFRILVPMGYPVFSHCWQFLNGWIAKKIAFFPPSASILTPTTVFPPMFYCISFRERKEET